MTTTTHQGAGSMRLLGPKDKCSGHARIGSLVWPICIRCKRLQPTHGERVGTVYIADADPQRVATCNEVLFGGQTHNTDSVRGVQA